MLPVSSREDYKLASVHILATEHGVHASQNDLWHMQNIARYFTSPVSIIMHTNHIAVDVTSAESLEQGVRW